MAGGAAAACAACKYQRRKCAPDCPLAPYFPADQPKKFANVHRLFGVSNVLRLLKHVEPARRDDTVKSIAYEADARERDPVHGCLGVVAVLQAQAARLHDELAAARSHLLFLEQQQHATVADLGGGYGAGFSSSTFVDDNDDFLLRHDDEDEDGCPPAVAGDANLGPKPVHASPPLDYRYGGDGDAPLIMSRRMKAEGDQRYFGTSPPEPASFGESPMSHLQAALEEHDGGGGGHASFGVRTPSPDATSHRELRRRAGVYLTLTSQN